MTNDGLVFVNGTLEEAKMFCEILHLYCTASSTRSTWRNLLLVVGALVRTCLKG